MSQFRLSFSVVFSVIGKESIQTNRDQFSTQYAFWWKWKQHGIKTIRNCGGNEETTSKFYTASTVHGHNFFAKKKRVGWKGAFSKRDFTKMASTLQGKSGN